MSFCEAERKQQPRGAVKPITLQSQPDKLTLSFVFIFSTTLCSTVTKAGKPQWSITDLIGSAAVGIAACLTWHWTSTRKLRIDANGIHITRHIFKSFSVPWKEIVSIGTASVGAMEEGLNTRSFTHHVGIQLHPESSLYHSKQCRDNRRLSDFDVLINAAYGMSVPRFAEFLARRKKRFYKPASNVESIAP